MNKKINTNTMNFKFGIYSLLIAVGLLFTSCVGDDDFNIPSAEGSPAIIDGEIMSIGQIIQMIDENVQPVDDPDEQDIILNETLTSFEDIFIEGYVISTDQAGNFFRELIIQDSPENPTAGIKIEVDINPLFGRFEPGRKVYLRMDGLTIGRSFGVVTGMPLIGIGAENNRMTRIQEAQANQILIRDNVVEQIVPKLVEFSDFNTSLMCQALRVENVQFPAPLIEQGISFAGEPGEQFDVERELESCETNETRTFATSSFADFKSNPLPSGSGAMNFILLRNFFSDKFLMKTPLPTQIFFDQERCDPEPAEPLCDGPSGGNDVIFSEDFNGISDLGQLNGWDIVNTTGGSLNWVRGSFDGNGYAQISGFNSDQAYDAWLVTPEINLGNSSLEEFKLDIESSFDNGRGLTVLITENYTGDVTTTEWQELEGIEVPQGPSSGFGGFSPAGVENISCLENIRFAFRYQGSDPDGVTTRYHLDNIRIEGELN
ncbi:MAG: DUF5689 domain-containing protein [Flavobacteriaceae bacterium]|nr:DUF5689 domain-containing protein [Flavobacteriaceae bacterium]